MSDFSRHEEKSTLDLTPQILTFAPASHLSLTLPYSWEGKGKTFLAGRGRIQSLSPCRREVWREVFQIL
jgi:hypothetical protein